MLLRRSVLSADNLNNAFLSKTGVSAQGIASSLNIGGGAITLKNTIISDSISSAHLRIDPQGNVIAVYDGVNNQAVAIYSSSGTEATSITSINAPNNKSYGLIDVIGTSMHRLELNTNSEKPIAIPMVGMQWGTSPQEANNFYLVNNSVNDNRGFRLYNGENGSGKLLVGVSALGDMSIGTPSPITYNNRRTFLTVKGKSDAGVLELAQGSAETEGATIGQIQFADVYQASSEKNIASITSYSEGSTATRRGGNLVFSTRPDNNDAPREVLRISSSGNVGIGGVSNPGHKLHVNGDMYASGWLRTSDANGWYNHTHGGGWHMNEATRIRSFGAKGVTIEKSVGAISGSSYLDSHLELRSSDSSPVVLSFNRNGYTALSMYHDGTADPLKIMTSANVPFNIGMAGRKTATQLNDATSLPSGVYENSGDGILNANGTVFKAGWYHVFHSRHIDGNGYAGQIAMNFIGGDFSLYFRYATGTTWGAWRRMFAEGSINNVGASGRLVLPVGINYYATTV